MWTRMKTEVCEQGQCMARSTINSASRPKLTPLGFVRVCWVEVVRTIALVCGINFSGCAFIKHRAKFSKRTADAARDQRQQQQASSRCLPGACLVENGAHYTAFAKFCKELGLSEYLDAQKVLSSPTGRKQGGRACVAL